jgi:DMSO/TMAO reductase YedYZ heme-binding membrane subunit
MSEQIFWYLTRSSALVAWLAAAGSVLVGVSTSARLLGRRPTVPWLVDLHRMLSALASVFVLIHMATLWFDDFVRFRLADLLVPGVATVPGLSRLSLALGVVAAWLLAVVEISSLLRGRLGDQLWRTIHFASYATMALGSVHAVLAGSDVGNPIVAAVGVSVLTAVVLATTVRLARARRPGPEVELEPPLMRRSVTGERRSAPQWEGPPLGGMLRPTPTGTRPPPARQRGGPPARG